MQEKKSLPSFHSDGEFAWVSSETNTCVQMLMNFNSWCVFWTVCIHCYSMWGSLITNPIILYLQGEKSLKTKSSCLEEIKSCQRQKSRHMRLFFACFILRMSVQLSLCLLLWHLQSFTSFQQNDTKTSRNYVVICTLTAWHKQDKFVLLRHTMC